MDFHIFRYNKPILAPKKILLWYQGGFPTTNVSVDSFLLPTRLFPNSEITVRCKGDAKTLCWLESVLKPKYQSYKILPDNYSPQEVDFSKYDIVWNHDYWFCKGGASEKAKADWKWILDNVTEPTLASLFCDPLVTRKIMPTPNRKDWSNVMVFFNQDIVENWAPGMFEGWESVEKKPLIAYVNMRLYYNLPTFFKFSWHPYKTGVYFANFHSRRVTFFKKVLKDFNPELLHIGGRNSSALADTQFKDSIDCGSFPHNEILGKLLRGAWALYIGRVKPICWLGMTFYLPFIAGIPVFCYDGCTEAHRVFGNLQCYFKTSQELEDLVNNTDLKELFYKQTERLKSFYNI